MKVKSLILLVFMPAFLFGQVSTGDLDGRDSELNIVKYSVPFLTIAPDSRAGAMGDLGAATSPDVNSMHWNPAKYAFIDGDMGMSLSYTPWLRNLIDDINLAYLSFYKRMDSKQVISASFMYFSLGQIIFTDYRGEYTGQHNPNELALDVAYSRKLSDNFSGSIAFRYIRSDITGGAYLESSGESHAGNSFAADVSFFYQNNIDVADKDATLAFGLNMSNLGSKLSYTDDSQKQFIPSTMRLGSALTIDIDEYNAITFATDLSKFLVPTPPLEGVDENGDPYLIGMDSDVSLPVGVFQSFYDAPGGLEEELHEIMYSVGMEYWYENQFALRAGYFNEHETKGNRKYFTLGLGLKLNVFGIDFAYLIPQFQNHPLANTLRFSINFDFDALRAQNGEI